VTLLIFFFLLAFLFFHFLYFLFSLKTFFLGNLDGAAYPMEIWMSPNAGESEVETKLHFFGAKKS
jgi:hypothetical protein